MCGGQIRELAKLGDAASPDAEERLAQSLEVIVCVYYVCACVCVCVCVCDCASPDAEEACKPPRRGGEPIAR